MDDLAQWLRAQLDEDERIARGADPGPWKSESLGRHDQSAIKLAAPTSLIQFDGSRAAANGMHVSRHDPARVLREIDAKRKLVDEHQPDAFGDCTTCAQPEDFDEDAEGNRTWSRTAKPSPCPTLRLLALPLSDRDGYREEWAP